MKTAILVDEKHSPSGAAQKLYRLSEPVGYDHDWDTGKPKEHTDHVLVSAVVAMFSGPETYIFPTDAEGKVLDWGELDGSYRGGLNHERALEDAGYTIE